jgi:epoxyqueuosine reductase
MEDAVKHVFFQLNERGYQGHVVPIRHLQDLREEIEGRHAQGLLNDEFYQEWLSRFEFKPPALQGGKPPENLTATSLIVVAIPRPQIRVDFHWNGSIHSIIIPPTYVGYEDTRQRIQEFLAGLLAPAGFHIAPARIPLKLLAVRSGLAQYGRNNICYVPGMGSFFQLVAVYSDLPCTQDPWQEAHMMERCQDCHACRNRCPSGAIPSDRFLLRAERCIVFHNERSGRYPFPAWLDPTWHNCLIGCMLCQRVCPEDRDVLGWVEQGEEFSQDETRLLLEGVQLDQLPVATVDKLKRLDLADSVDALPRNMGVLFAQSTRDKDE